MRQGGEFTLLEKRASAASVASELRKIGINDACLGVSACACLHMSVRKLVGGGGGELYFCSGLVFFQHSPVFPVTTGLEAGPVLRDTAQQWDLPIV